MVDRISPISATAPSHATRIDRSTSIDSEPDNVWVAHQQSKITENLLSLGSGALHRDDIKQEVVDGDASNEQHTGDDDPQSDREHQEQDPPKLSGESDRIGNGNLDEDAPFGEHVGYV